MDKDIKADIKVFYLVFVSRQLPLGGRPYRRDVVATQHE